MTSTGPRVIQPGEPAPDFTLPTVHQDGTVSLADYRGRRAVLLAFFRGIHCPFCRRHVARLGLVQDKLLAAGVETLAVIASDLDRTRLYYQYRPTRVPLAADPDMASHRAFGIVKMPVTAELMHALEAVRTDVMGELPQPLPIGEAVHALQQKDGFEFTPADAGEAEQQFPMDTGQFLVDRGGIVRWAHLDLARKGVAAIGQMSSDEELLTAARALRA
jgi:peroxiredoxin